jgi:cell division protein FtsL
MYAVRRPVANVYLVRERDRRRSRELLAFALAALPPMAVLFAAIWANLETVRLGYQLERLDRQREQLVEKNRQLKTARAQASALSRIESVARGRLGLLPPRPDQLVLIRDGGAEPPRVAPLPAIAVPAPPVAPAPAPATATSTPPASEPATASANAEGF